jgi:regulatory protein
MIVTKIERQKKDPDRFSLFVDGSFVAGIHSSVLLRAGLRRGDDISEDTLRLLRSDEEVAAARASAARYAGHRRRTEHEIRTKLADLSFSTHAIETAVGNLRDSGLIDDRAYVRAYIHDSGLHRPAGGRMIAHRLRGKGIPAEILREEIASALGPEQERPLAERCMVRYLAKLDGREATGKQFRPGEREAALRRYLAGRGFSRGTVDSVARSAPHDTGGGG